MSYILDALRKSDQQRQRGMPPALLAPHAAADVPRRRVSTSHILVAALLVAAGVVIGSLRPWQTEQPAATTEPAAMKPVDSSPRPSPVPVLPQMSRESKQDVAPAKKAASAARSAPAPAAGAIERQAPAVAKSETKAATPDTPREDVTTALKETAKPAPAKADGASPRDAAPEQKVMTIAELPVAIQQEMPKMSISVHAYSREPKDRLVGINDRVLREGEYVAPGLMLEQITLDGMIMSYKGYRFRRGVR